MRGTVAKRLRRRVYGDMSLRGREYRGFISKIREFWEEVKAGGLKGLLGKTLRVKREIKSYTIKADPLRQQYQRAKRRYTRHAA